MQVQHSAVMTSHTEQHYNVTYRIVSYRIVKGQGFISPVGTDLYYNVTCRVTTNQTVNSTQLTCESESTTDTTLVNVLHHNKQASIFTSSSSLSSLRLLYMHCVTRNAAAALKSIKSKLKITFVERIYESL